MDDTVHDDLKHGESKQQFGTGAQRDTQEDKVQYSLVPPSPHRRVAMIYTKGAVHYGPNNWTMGIPFSRYLDSADRHIEAARMGMQDEDHLAMAVWNLYGIMHHQENGPPGLDDLPRWDDARWQSTGLTFDQIEHPEIYPHIFEKLQETGKLEMIVERVGRAAFTEKLQAMGFDTSFEDAFMEAARRAQERRDEASDEKASEWETSVAKEIAERQIPEGYVERQLEGTFLLHEDLEIAAGGLPTDPVVFIESKQTREERMAREELS